MPTASGAPSRRFVLAAIQVVATLAIIASDLDSRLRLALLLVLWAITFHPLRARELALFAIACVFFGVMNALSLKQGIFRFERPDYLGMPVWEFAMWGFYLLHTLRLLDGPAPAFDWRVAVLALLYAAAFGAIPDAGWLLGVTATLLLAGLLLHHERLDLLYAGYMILLGALVEYTGVWSGQWSYPSPPAGDVPPWFITLWGGVGYFLRRLVLPVLARPAAGDAPRRPA